MLIHPENVTAFEVFVSMRTQWRTGMNGVTGLDYTALPVVEARCGVKKKQRQEVFLAVQVMEDEVLRIMAAKRDR